MTEIHDCERVIRRVTSDTEPTRDSERRVIIDVKYGRAVDRVDILNFWRQFKYFIVSNSDDPDNEASGMIHLTYRTSPGTPPAEIEIAYKGWCLPGKEKQVCETLFHGDDPGEVLSGLISKWVVEHISSQNGSFKISNIDSKNFLEAAIRTKAQMEVGLTMEVEFSLKSPPIRMSDSFLVRAKDYAKEETLTLSIELGVDRDAELSATQYPGNSLRDFIRAEIQSYFAYNVSMQGIYFKLHDDEFRYLLTRYLNEALKSRSLKVIFLALERVQQTPAPPEFFKAQVNTTYGLDEHVSPVVLKSTVLMNIQNVARYLASGSPDLMPWVESQCQRLIHQELIGVQYTDLVVGFEPFAEKIEKNLRLAALAIGYNIQYFKSLPDLEPYRWLEGIQIKTEDTEEEFETSLPKFFVKLRFSLTVRMRDLRAIRPFLERQQYVPALTKKALLDVTRQFLRRIHPRQFYTQFSPPQASGGFVFEKELQTRLSNMLEQRFHAEIIEALFEVGDTEVTRRLEKLRSESYEFNIAIPRNIRSAEDRKFRGYFKVDRVADSGWEDFRIALPTITQVKGHLEDGVKTALENHPTALVAFKDTFNLDGIKNVVEQAAQSTVLNAFGLDISLSHIGSDAVDSEKKIAVTITEAQTKSIEMGVKRYFSITALVSEQIASLESQMVMTKAAGGPQDIIEDIQKRIEALKSHTPIEPIIPRLSYEHFRDTQKAKKPV